jgi:ribosomal protein S18 acetylase RimI-like enzyme
VAVVVSVAVAADRVVAVVIANADAIINSFFHCTSFEPNGRRQPFGSIYFLEIAGKISMTDLVIREYRASDFDAVTILWRISREKSLPDFQLEKGHFFYEDRDYFQSHVLMENQVWVVEKGQRLVAFMAMNQEFVDQLYIHPDHWRQGIGNALLDLAREQSPEHVWLYTLQINLNARAFYEKNGFVAEKFGVSPPPESEPDVEYHWRKSSIVNSKS